MTREIEIKAEDFESLLYDLLEEIIFLFETEELIVADSQLEINPVSFTLNGILKGEILDRTRHELLSEVKAVTYFGMEINRNPYSVKVTLDL